MARQLQFTEGTALGISATFTSRAIDGEHGRRITGFAYADQAGELFFEHSEDGTTWRRSAATAVAASTLVGYDQVIFARYVRLVYVNGAVGQTVFQLNSYLLPE